jgi:hypothetical protein
MGRIKAQPSRGEKAPAIQGKREEGEEGGLGCHLWTSCTYSRTEGDMATEKTRHTCRNRNVNGPRG